MWLAANLTVDIVIKRLTVENFKYRSLLNLLNLHCLFNFNLLI